MALTAEETKKFEELIKAQTRLMQITAIANKMKLNEKDEKKLEALRKEIDGLSEKLNVTLTANITLEDVQKNFDTISDEHKRRLNAASAIVQTDSQKALDDLIKLYNDKFMENGAYKKGYAQPQVEKSADGKQQVRFEFPDDKSLMAFARELANPPRNKSFTVLDEKGNVLAHSTGDGKLYHGANDPKSSNKQAIEPDGDFQRPKPPAPADTTPKPT